MQVSLAQYAYEGASILNRGYCKRVQCLRACGIDSQHTSAREEQDAREEIQAWKAFVAVSPAFGHMRDRGQAIRDMIPRLLGS